VDYIVASKERGVQSTQCGGPATERTARTAGYAAAIGRYVRLNFTQLGMPTEIPLLYRHPIYGSV
jgi:hypothetical protein